MGRVAIPCLHDLLQPEMNGGEVMEERHGG